MIVSNVCVNYVFKIIMKIDFVFKVKFLEWLNCGCVWYVKFGVMIMVIVR